MARLLDEIRKAIRQSDQTQYRIAEETEISRAALSRLMSGERGLSVETVEKLANYLGLEIICRPRRRQSKKGG